MDGNNRWSIINKVSKINAYKKGADKLFSLSNYLFSKYDIKYISAFALSHNNLKRNKNFKKIIFNLIDQYLDQFDNLKFEYKIKFIGDLSIFRQSTINKLQRVESKNNHEKILNIFINYSGRLDIIEALKKYKYGKINLNNFTNYLSTSYLPEPNIVYRSGGYSRISDFMLYQISFSELFFSKKLWPDINQADLDKIIIKYKAIERKFGF